MFGGGFLNQGGDGGGEEPPPNDICPICHDAFNIPCRTNCNHWFCANCILVCWRFKSVEIRCDCPICKRPISRFSINPIFQHQQDFNEIQGYNEQFLGGLAGIYQRVLRVIDPRAFYFHEVRAFAMFLGFIYNAAGFQFLPTGLQAMTIFDSVVVVLLLTFHAVAICWRFLRHGG